MIRGNIRPMGPTAKQTLDLRASIHNRFDVEVRDAATGELKQKAQAFNVICEALWDRVLNGTTSWTPQTYFNQIVYGSGSGTPSSSDTALFTRLGAKSITNISASTDIASGVIYRQGYITLNAEDNVGDTLTEVGIGYDATHIVTHALLQDMNGNPISIEKTATDVIKIYATVYLHFPAAGWYNGSLNVSQISGYSMITELLGPNGDYSARTIGRWKVGNRTGLSDSSSYAYTYTAMSVSIDRANKTMTFTTRIAAGELNTPIRAICIAMRHKYNSSYWDTRDSFWLVMGSWFTPPEIKGEAIGTGDGTTTGFATAFPVKTAGTVYVDGVAASGVTMRPGPASAGNLNQWVDVCYKTAANTAAYSSSSYYNDSAELNISLDAGAKSGILESPFPALGVAKLTARSNGSMKVLASDDLVTWSDVGTFPSTDTWGDLAVAAALRNKRYWQIENTDSATKRCLVKFVGNAADLEHNIVFSTPPAAGAVITADYTPDCIAKDENHVFDLSMVLTLGEYQEA